MRILIFGAKGQLGRDLIRIAALKHEVQGHDLPECDITDSEAVSSLVNAFAPDAIINAAAYTNVEAAEEDVETAWKVNETGAEIIAQAAANADAPVLFYSTDYVFGGGQTTPYKPDAPLDPIGVYARSKAAGEAATAKATPRHFIVRTAWLYGPGGNNFVEKILSLAEKHPKLRVVEDEVGSPTHTLDLAKASLALLTTQAYGIYHGVNEGSCSRYDFARRILELANSDTPVEACLSSEFPTKAERPLYSVLDIDALTKASGYAMPDWDAALQQYMARRKNPDDLAVNGA